MKKYRYIPAFVVTCLLIVITVPKPQFSFYGINWLLIVLGLIWTILIARDFRIANIKEHE